MGRKVRIQIVEFRRLGPKVIIHVVGLLRNDGKAWSFDRAVSFDKIRK